MEQKNAQKHISLTALSSPTVNDAISFFLTAKRAENVGKKTLQLYEYHLDRFAKFAESAGISLIENVNSFVISAYLASVADNWKPSTCHIAFRNIRTLTYWYEDFSDGDYKSPCRKMRAPKIPKNKKPTVNLETFRALLNGCIDRNAARDKALLLFAFDSAMRKNEIRELNIENVDLITGRVEILHGKGDKFGITYVSAPTLRALRKYLKTRSVAGGDEPLFATSTGTRFTIRGLSSVLIRIQQRAGINVHGFHSFRRGFGTEFIRNGGDLSTLQKIYRHSDISTTVSYLGLTDDDITRAHNAASPVARL
nr:MAG TPA: SITE SPECIFIC RECOMBINASE XERD [Bacteriophage sp.]